MSPHKVLLQHPWYQIYQGVTLFSFVTPGKEKCLPHWKVLNVLPQGEVKTALSWILWAGYVAL